MSNPTYPREPCLCGAPDCPRCFPGSAASARLDEAVESELEYRTRHQPLAIYADQLGEAFGDDGLGNLPLLLREGTDAEVRNELARLFDSYWSRRIRATLETQRKVDCGLSHILRGIRG